MRSALLLTRNSARAWQSILGGRCVQSFRSPAVRSYATASRPTHPTTPYQRRQDDLHTSDVSLVVNDSLVMVSPYLLRDMCTCERCVDPSTRQKLFLTTDIPVNIFAKTIEDDGEKVYITWKNDIGSSDATHKTTISTPDLARLAGMTETKAVSTLPDRITWNDEQYRSQTSDISFDAYMQDDSTLLQVLKQLQTHGLAFLTSVPESAESVSQIAQRIGPLKNTFYGSTWDVRSVPQAKNVAYTSQDLGFHMDLLYMHQPPHLQFLHCIRSSAAGGASLFTDSYRAVEDLARTNFKTLLDLATRDVSYHYNHMESDYYHQSRPVISLKPLKYKDLLVHNPVVLKVLHEETRHLNTARDYFIHKIVSFIDSVAWSPPFQAPFQISELRSGSDDTRFKNLNGHIGQFLRAGKAFNQLIHRPEGIYERMMKPGECVLFDNRRVLHARKAFEAGDAGKERWLRGAYLDKDPFESKLRVLQKRFGAS